MRSIQTRRVTLIAPLALGLLAGSVASPSVTHAQTAHAGLSTRDRALLVPVLPSIARCNVDLSTVTADLQQASDNINGGSLDMGSLRSDALQMRTDCLFAATRVTRVGIASGAAHRLARRVKSELRASLVDFAQGADACTRFVDDVSAGDGTAALRALRAGTGAWKAAQAHVRVAARYLRLR